MDMHNLTLGLWNFARQSNKGRQTKWPDERSFYHNALQDPELLKAVEEAYLCAEWSSAVPLLAKKLGLPLDDEEQTSDTAPESTISPAGSLQFHDNQKIATELQDYFASIRAELLDFLRLPSAHRHYFLLPEDQKHAEFVKSLKIPAKGTKPDLFLHEQGSGDFVFANWFEGKTKELLSHPSGLLVQTSGAGKSRTLVECLHREWGFYFTCYKTSNLPGTGSYDLCSVVLSESAKYHWLPQDIEGPIFGKKLRQNRSKARHRTQRALKARFLILELFLAVGREAGIDDFALKSRWTQLQLSPGAFMTGDIFMEVTKLLKFASDDYLSWISDWRRIIARLQLTPGASPVLILDEAQKAAQSHEEYFRDSTNRIKRPILRELVSTLSQSTTLIISGTGVSLPVVKEATHSMISKSTPLKVHSHLGGFDDRGKILRYLWFYTPEGFVTAFIVERLYRWLRGRYRLLASYVEGLIKVGYVAPHRVLNLYVRCVTGYTPSDADEIVAQEPEIDSSPFTHDFEPLKFDSLDSDDQRDLRHEICQTLFRYIFLSDSGLNASYYEPMVELGFARYVGTRGKHYLAQADEPLALLAGLRWMTAKESTMARFLDDCLRTDNGRGFELLVAYYLTIVFGTYKDKLSNIFNFKKGNQPDWADKRGRLVAINVQESGELGHADVDFGGEERVVSARLGYKSPGSQETLEWFRNPNYTAFCFPDNNMGPDICFFLRLENTDRIIPVFVQVKWNKDPNQLLKRSVLSDAARTMVPQNFFKDRSGNTFTPVKQPNLDIDIDRELSKWPDQLALLAVHAKAGEQRSTSQIAIDNGSLPTAFIRIDDLREKISQAHRFTSLPAQMAHQIESHA